MKILLIGYGKMGKAVEKIAPIEGHEIVDRATSQKPLNEKMIKNADVCIEFSHPDQVLSHVKLIAPFQIPLIIGTTGWEKHLQQAQHEIEKHQSSALFATNFSLGVALFISMLKKAQELFSAYPEYDIGGIEWHHSQKIDSPSGTARIIQEQCNFPFTSIRLGSLFPKHEILFDSPTDTISLSHNAKNRDGYAKGALHAAQWIIGKKGWFTLNDMLHSTDHTL